LNKIKLLISIIMETEIYQTDDISRIISFLQEQGLLNRSFRCHKCNTSMELKDRAAGDKKTWRCPKYSCQTFKYPRISLATRNKVSW
jgi:hypothetical protein